MAASSRNGAANDADDEFGPCPIEDDLPLVLLIGSDPVAAQLVTLILGDLCRIECHDEWETLLEIDESDPPEILLQDIRSLAKNPVNLKRLLQEVCPVAATAVMYLSTTDACTGNDGTPLGNCFVSTGRPSELRATIEARLRRRRSCEALHHSTPRT